ncbi:MAG: DUF4173 domain-containing protein [Chloroflexi bacterium]|nr:DUF4173 domain-containing protein [Chloroflexota bacterium]
MSSHNAPDGAPDGATPQNIPGISRPWFVLAVTLVVGFLVEALLHGQRLGLGFALAALIAAVGWLVLGRGLAARPSGSAIAVLAILVIAGALVALRASPALQVLDLLTGIGAVLLLAALFTTGGLTRFSLTDYAAALFISGLATMLQPFALLFGDLPKARLAANRGRGLAPVLWGVLLALPLLIVFAALFASADAVFAAYLRRLFDWDLAELLTRAFLSLALSWAAAGLARHAFAPRIRLDHPPSLDFLRVGAQTAITLLTLVNALFLAFVAVQAVYLFGGADTLGRSGLTHSEYARRGFFELVTVAALALSLILLLDWLQRDTAGQSRRWVNLLHGVLVLLTLAILVSALQRMRLYVQDYGLTELRFYTTAFMGWLAVVLIWLAATVLWGRRTDGIERRRFAFGSLIAGVLLIIGLNLVNPDATIARVNLDRAIAGIGQPLDARYLTRNLSADAAAALVEGLVRLPDREAQARLACELQASATRLNQHSGQANWRGLNWGRVSGRRTLNQADSLVASFAVGCPSR